MKVAKLGRVSLKLLPWRRLAVDNVDSSVCRGKLRLTEMLNCQKLGMLQTFEKCWYL